MISISSSTKFKTVCKRCNSPPIRFKKLGKYYGEDRDILKIMQDNATSHSFYVFSPNHVVETFLQQRVVENVNLNLSYLSFPIQDYKVSSTSHRKHRVRPSAVNSQHARVIATCKCKNSHWIFIINNKEFFPESCRKSNITK